MREAGGQLRLCDLHPYMQENFRLHRLHEIFPIYPDLDGAIQDW